MNWDREDRGLKYRVVVTHHHLLAVNPQEEIDRYGRIYSVMLDAGELSYRLLSLDVDLVLHGHMHQPFVASIAKRPDGVAFPPGRGLVVHATGSAGVRREHTGSIGRNAFTLVEFSPANVTLRVRALSENRIGFQDHWSAKFARSPSGGLVFADA
jgi:hypothetical protein